MIKIFKSEQQDEHFYSLMGKYFASLDVAKELERQVYNKQNSVWFISTFKGSVNGFAALFDNGKYYFLDNLYVIPECRNKGIAKELVQEIISLYNDKPIKLVANNQYALKIFNECKFIEVGKNGKYKKFIKY